MKPLVVSSLNQSAGKSSVIIGMAKALGKSFAYLKPFGDRLLYKKKRQWDYDSALLTNLFGLDEIPELTTLGFDHSKLRFMYTQETISAKLREMAQVVEPNHDLFFVEGGRSLTFGCSVHLDPVAVATCLGAQLVIVLRGNEVNMGDQLSFLKQNLDTNRVKLAGVILNKVKDLDEYETTYKADLESYGLPILGALPYQQVLTEYPVSYLSEQVFARVIAGEAGMDRQVRNIFVATTGVQSARRNPEFSGEGTLVVTSGDRSDMILAALDADTAGILLTDEAMPPANIISAAEDKDIPLLIVRQSTAKIATKLAELDSLLTKEDTDKVDLLGDLVNKHVDLSFITG